MGSVQDAAGRAGPLAAGPLIGREVEVEVVRALLADPEAQVVVLTGPSGIGKTRLALEALPPADVIPSIVVALSSIQDGHVMSDAIVAEVGGAVVRMSRPADALWQAFGGGPVVLLLDNLEQVVGAADTVLDLVSHYPRATVLCTSLREVGVPTERVVRLTTLPVPDVAALEASPPHRAARLGASAAPALVMFLERAGRRDVVGRFGDADLVAAARICRSVGGLPLAIELAAARTGSTPLSLIADQLEGSGGLGLLEQRTTLVPQRHRSLQAALRWTTELLPRAAADLLATMSVFEGPATLEAVARVARPGDPTLDSLSTLLDVSLVEVDGTVPDDPVFSLLPTVRAFAAERLRESGDLGRAVERHDDFVRARCRTGTPLSPHEVADVIAALDRVQLDGAVDAALELALVAAGVTGAPGATSAVATRVESLLQQAEGEDRVLAARALAWSVTSPARRADDHDAFAAWTHSRVRRAISTARASGDVPALLDALELTVRTLPTTLDRELAVAGIEEGMALAQQTGQEGRLARFRMWVGMAALSDGHDEQARELLWLAHTGGRAAGDRVASDYAAVFLRTLDGRPAPSAPTGRRPASAAPDDVVRDVSDLPELPALLDSAWRHRDAHGAAVVLAQLVREALDAGDVFAAARHVRQLLPIGTERQDVQPVVAATILTLAVRLFVAAGRLEEAAGVQASLAPLQVLLTHSLSQTDHLAYSAAVERLVAAGWVEDVGRTPGPSLREAHQVAGRGLLSLLADVDPGSPPILGPAVPSATQHREPSSAIDVLSPREREVLAMLVDGSGNRELAVALGISPKTVMHHTVSIYRKLGVRGRTEAATVAVRAGLPQGR